MNGQKLLPAGIPWYRTRLFWGIIYIIIVSIAGFYAYSWISTASSPSILSMNQLLTIFTFSLGGALLFLLGASLGPGGTWIAVVFFYAIVVYLVYQTFRREAVPLRYPIILVILFASGMTTGMLYMAGL